jgi:hypothetical protein
MSWRLLMTAGRLSDASRKSIHQIFVDEANQTKAVLKAQMAIVTAPEFHVTNIARKKKEEPNDRSQNCQSRPPNHTRQWCMS